MANQTIKDIENIAEKYTLNNVGQCWRCKNKGSDAVFRSRDEKEGTLTYYRLPECVLYHCYMTHNDDEVCQDFQKKD